MSDRKIINDPVFGFINIPKGLLYDIVCHPLLQRLTRIKQLGLSSAVYPGAQHTRFQHSLGAFHLMSETIKHLTAKGNFIFDSEAEAVQAAILLHDIGHGPFSHVLENTLVGGVSHEEISLMLMERINKDMKGQLNLAIQIFKDEYPKKFLHQLVSGQLDMDRLDYLRRDSFYTGVSEGNIGSARIIKMLDVKDDHLVVESKGIYSIENFLMSRRLMALAEKNDGSVSVIPAADVCTCKEKCEAGKVNTGCPVCKNDLNGCIGKEKPAEPEEPAESEQPKKDTGSVGTIIFIIVALLAVGGVGYYVKIVRPKQQAADEDEFDEDDGYGEGFDPDEAYGEPEYLSEDDFEDSTHEDGE